MDDLNSTTNFTEDDFREDVRIEELNNVELYFEDTGPKDAPVLFYLHGGPGYNAYSFRDIVGESLGRYRVVYLDQRGGGRSGALPATGDLSYFTIDAMTDDVEAVRESLGIQKLIPFGHGFGAVIALEYARRFPQHVAFSLLVNPWINFPELSQTLLEKASELTGQPLTSIPHDSETRVERAFTMLNSRDLLSRLHFPNPQGRLRLEFSDSESALLAGGDLQEGLVANGLWEFEYAPYLSDVSRPIAVIAGMLDPTSYPAQSDWLVDLGGAQLVELEDCGHYPWLDDLDAFVQAVQYFVKLPKPN
jgi:proline iminopeptidase